MSAPESVLAERSIRRPSDNGWWTRRIPAALFAAYLALLFWTVLWKLHEPYVGGDWMRAVKLVPFAAADGFGASAPFEVAMNVVIFAPFGVYLGILAPSLRVAASAALFAATSVVLEVAQFVFALGSSDVTDVIVNTAGGLAGLGLVALARRGLRARTAAVVTRISLVASVVVAGAVAVHISSFPRLPM